MIWQISLAVIKYYGYPTSTTVTYEYRASLEFPAVTVCNNNPMRNSLLQASSSAADLKRLASGAWAEEYINSTVDNSTAAPTFDDWYEDSEDSDYEEEEEPEEYVEEDDVDEDTLEEVWYQGEEDPTHSFIEDFITISSQLTGKERFALGHQLSTMFVSCTWQGKKCKASQFASFNNYMYGNCYTFNAGRLKGNKTKSTSLKTDKIGPLYGFSLELYIEQHEYITGLADSAGVRVFIHNQTVMPFPEDYGLSLQPGAKTSIGITRKDTYRAKEPHGSCNEYSDQENAEKNAFLFDIDSISYSVPACRKTCYQKALMSNCSCYDHRVPSSQKIVAYKDLETREPISRMKACFDDGVYTKKEPCIKNITAAFVSTQLGCNTECHNPCLEVEYPYTVSYAQWPSLAIQEQVLDKMSMKSREMRTLVEELDEDIDAKQKWLNENFLKMEVYFSDLNYVIVKTSPSYDAIALISDLGGQAGLWLGVSVIAFFELFELILDLTILTAKYMKNKSGKTPANKLVPDSRPSSGISFGSNESLDNSRPSTTKSSLTAKNITVHEL